MAVEKAKNTIKELIISIIAIVVSIILAVFALGVANWAVEVFNITGDYSQAAALIAVAIVIGSTIAAVATKKYY